MTEAMAAMLLLSFAVLLFSAMIIQSGRLMDRGQKAIAYYEAGQNALNARDTGNAAIDTADAAVLITGANGENAFSGLTPDLRTGEGNTISVKLYRQKLDWSRDLFTYDRKGYETAYVEAEDKGE